MSRDIYEHRHTFEDNSKTFKLSNGWEFKATTLSFDKEKVTPVVMRGLTEQEISKIKNHGKNI